MKLFDQSDQLSTATHTCIDVNHNFAVCAVSFKLLIRYLKMLLILNQSLPKIFLVMAILFNFSPQPLKANTMPFNQTEIEQKLQAIPQWKQKEQTITRTFKFKNFVEAIAFVNKLVEPAEAAGHHPDLEISYNKVVVSLTSHDAGGLTQKDFDLAQTISGLAQ